MVKNKHGLQRAIPRPIKKQIRAACGFGCVICGNAIYHYEHIDPPYAEATEHIPDKIALLCGGCHDKVTRPLWSKDKVLKARLNPKCKEEGFSSFSLDIDDESDFIVTLGRITFINTDSILKIDDKDILKISKPEAGSSPPLISAEFYDREGKFVAEIQDNEWRGSSSTFDIETVGPTIKIRSKERHIDLEIKLRPPNAIDIQKINLSYNGKQIYGDLNKGFVFKTPSAEMTLTNNDFEAKNSEFGIILRNEKIIIGIREVLDLVMHEDSIKPSSMELEGATAEFYDPEEIDEPAPPGFKKGQRGGRLFHHINQNLIDCWSTFVMPVVGF